VRESGRVNIALSSGVLRSRLVGVGFSESGWLGDFEPVSSLVVVRLG